MSSLARTFSLTLLALTAGISGLSGCGGTEPSPYIAGFDPPSLDSFRGGMTQRVQVRLSQVVKEKTYVDITISSTDQTYVRTDPVGYIIFAAGTDRQVVDVIAQTSTSAVNVSLEFCIRQSTTETNKKPECRDFGFQILP
jgi:hypothetical protein